MLRVVTMAFHFTCPSCRGSINIDDFQAGWSVVCPRCHKIVPGLACDYYQVLQASPNADEEVIRAAYRLMATRWHPDRMPGDLDAAEHMKLLNEAYEVLSDRRKRQAYDVKRTAARLAKAATQPRPAKHEERPWHVRDFTEAKEDFRTGAADDGAPGRCWFCGNRRPLGSPISVRLWWSRGLVGRSEETVDLLRCSECERMLNRYWWIGGVGCLLMLLAMEMDGAALPMHLVLLARAMAGKAFPGPQEYHLLTGRQLASSYLAWLLVFCGGGVMLLLAFLFAFFGYRDYKSRAKEFPKVRDLMNRGWKLKSLIIPW